MILALLTFSGGVNNDRCNCFLAFVVGIGAIVVKAFERRQDVMHGPYIGRDGS
jgi:hypothetical protein